MNGNRLSPSDYQIFFLKSLLWLVLSWGGFVLALAGFFYATFIWVGTICFGFFLLRRAYVHRVYLRPSREMWMASIFFLLLVSVFAFNSTPSVFSGRDQGAISEAAIRLAQNHTFTFEHAGESAFFKLHESGRALNFPGFYYTTKGALITQFPLVYITWLALFFAIFGTFGFAIANAVLFYFFLFSLYLILRLFLETVPSLPTMLFVATSFVFMWFFKYTLSENMALPLLWLGILALMLYLRNERRLYYVIFISSFFLLCFTRIEGFAFLAAAIIVLCSHADARYFLKKSPFWQIVFPSIIFFVLFAANTFIDLNFYKELAKAMLPGVALPQAQSLGNLKNALPMFYTERIFYLYGMLGFFIFGFFALANYLWKKEYYKLIPFFVVLPTCIYFFNSHISTDHPWMLRRFMFSLLPVAILYSGLMLGQWFENKEKPHMKNLTLIVSFMLLLGNYPAFSNFLFFSENKNLLEQTKSLSQQFSSKDLILLDRDVTDNGWAMISGPMSSLFGRNAVYFFNITDLAKLDTSNFENVYLIAPNEQVGYYVNSTFGKRMSFVNNYTLTFTQLNSKQEDPLELLQFPKKETVTVQGKIFKISKNN